MADQQAVFNGDLGDFAFFEYDRADGRRQRRIVFRHPSQGFPRGEVCSVDIVTTPTPTAGKGPWQFDGNDDDPTLTPSIAISLPGGVEVWHGFITKGEMITC